MLTCRIEYTASWRAIWDGGYQPKDQHPSLQNPITLTEMIWLAQNLYEAQEGSNHGMLRLVVSIELHPDICPSSKLIKSVRDFVVCRVMSKRWRTIV